HRGVAPAMIRPPRIALLTVSDGVHAGAREDRSGARMKAWVDARGFDLAETAVVPDETAEIVSRLVEWSDAGGVDCILTSGGTGLAPRDVTPEATLAALEREAPGIAEALRTAGRASTPFAALGRGIAGVRGATLIVNLPGNPDAVSEGIEVLDPLIEHAVRLLRGDTEHPGGAPPDPTEPEGD
ncbi:MAG: MogA/MoaB family molybdenum cofactor biosynthesis protein, partial [Gemmatimonadota bacterium]|nr:MogA/MoaB family molybdenum cofactor biosynthesis protein [Gemmatimonadota bacterium]